MPLVDVVRIIIWPTMFVAVYLVIVRVVELPTVFGGNEQSLLLSPLPVIHLYITGVPMITTLGVRLQHVTFWREHGQLFS